MDKHTKIVNAHAFSELSHQIQDLFGWAIHPDPETVSTDGWLTAIRNNLLDAVELTLRAADRLNDVSLTQKINRAKQLSFELTAILNTSPALSSPPAELRYRRLEPELSSLEDEFRVLGKYDPDSKPEEIREIGPFKPQWLRAMFDVDDNRTLRDRLGNVQREESERKWHIPSSCLEALGDWKSLLRNASKRLSEKDKNSVTLFLSLH